ncbi:MAG: hypothetical protein ACREOJ_14345 [Gemmatimonadaceae bacterium]
MTCGGRHDAPVADGHAAPAAAAAAPSSSEPANAPATPAASGTPSIDAVILTQQDIARYRRGMEAELEYVRARAVDVKNAKSSSDSLNALFALSDEGGRRKAAVKAAGMDADQFRSVEDAIVAVLARWGNQRMVESMKQAADTATMSPELRVRAKEGLQRLTQGFSDLPKENVDLVLPHAAELDSLRVMPAALAVKVAERN